VLRSKRRALGRRFAAEVDPGDLIEAGPHYAG
jgi:hypothetical protein